MENMKHVGDVVAVGTVAGSLAGWLPPVAAAFTIFWMIMCIVIHWDKFFAKLRTWFGWSKK